MTRKLDTEALIALVVEAQKGNRTAYNRIVKQFQDLTVGYAYSILQDFSLAEEAAQEALLEAYFKIDSLLKPAAFSAWLKKIVFKHCDRITRKKRPLLIPLSQSRELISTQPNPHKFVEQQELKKIVNNAIAFLPDKEREVITLFYLSDRSQKEIGAFLEVPVSTVKNRLFSARKKLKRNFNSMVEDYLSNQRPSQNNNFTDRIDRIIDAAYNGDLTTIQTLLENNANLANVRDKDIKSTPLHFSAHRGYANIVKLLLSAGANINAEEGNYSKSAPLHWAATGGHFEIVKYLVEMGANLNARDNWYNLTPLGWAAILKICPPGSSLEEQHDAICTYLIEKGATLDIFSAIALNRTDLIDSLIKTNSEVLTHRLGFAMGKFQPLHFAIYKNMTEIAEFLVQKGANLAAKTLYGVTPLCMAIQTNNRRFVDLSSDRYIAEDLSALLISEQWLQAENLLKTQPNLILDNSLLLHYAIIKNLFSVVYWLVEKGAKLEKRNKYLVNDYVVNLTPLHVAIEGDLVEIAKLLVESGANINSKTTGELELTALQGAAAMGSVDIIRLLVEHNANFEIKDSLGVGTPLDWAKKFDRKAAIDFLKQLAR